MNTDRLEVESISKSFAHANSTINILQDVQFSANPGETVAIIGPSGSGKSTLLNILGLLEKPNSGSVKLGESELQELSQKEQEMFRAQHIGFVFQNHHLLPQLTALENVLLPTLVNTNIQVEANEILDFVGLKERKDFYPWQISGGECQRIAIARGIMSASKLLLCDEPTGNLDEENGQKIIGLLKEIAAKNKVVVVMVTHNVAYAKQFDTCYVLRSGRLVNEGV
ncbi:ABC transporter ATP-binding protein [Candidatus Uabimicrobium amorphum]|uniref:Lipoprotein-releasing system ATP-binding protein LolD n=1 Tax=Uabimicrobium amorphum TaxID=2596890 RepID=A0A5S9IUL4_UABAM|nr:ABC transporter ATP-binding protein [Candidatus Uabimicrobium amorphum]BBM88194.1 lipoprotein-releasing system ATP-binding protein LolD [Candidatus Uabimicrobium amorphum]